MAHTQDDLIASLARLVSNDKIQAETEKAKAGAAVRQRGKPNLLDCLSSHLRHDDMKQSMVIENSDKKVEIAEIVNLVNQLQHQFDCCKLRMELLYFYDSKKQEEMAVIPQRNSASWERHQKHMTLLYEMMCQCTMNLNVIQQKVDLLLSGNKENAFRKQSEQKRLERELLGECSQLLDTFFKGATRYSVKQFKKFIFEGQNSEKHWKTFLLRLGTSISSHCDPLAHELERQKPLDIVLRSSLIENIELYFDTVVQFERTSSAHTSLNEGNEGAKMGFSDIIGQLMSQQHSRSGTDALEKEEMNEESIEQKRLFIAQLSPQSLLELYRMITKETFSQTSKQLLLKHQLMLDSFSTRINEFNLTEKEKQTESFIKQYTRELSHTTQTINQHLTRLAQMSNETWIKLTRDPTSLMSKAQSLLELEEGNKELHKYTT